MEISRFRLITSSGSYQTKDVRTYWCRKINKLNFTVNVDYYDSEGYRDNGDIRKKDVSLHTGYALSDSITLNVQASYHNDTYGLPGAIEKKYATDKKGRKKATTPNIMDLKPIATALTNGKALTDNMKVKASKTRVVVSFVKKPYAGGRRTVVCISLAGKDALRVDSMLFTKTFKYKVDSKGWKYVSGLDANKAVTVAEAMIDRAK